MCNCVVKSQGGCRQGGYCWHSYCCARFVNLLMTVTRGKSCSRADNTCDAADAAAAKVRVGDLPDFCPDSSPDWDDPRFDVMADLIDGQRHYWHGYYCRSPIFSRTLNFTSYDHDETILIDFVDLEIVYIETICFPGGSSPTRWEAGPDIQHCAGEEHKAEW